MKCPYNCSKKVVSQSSNTVTEDNTKSSSIVTQVENYTFNDCYKDECAAWKNGSCVFNNDREEE